MRPGHAAADQALAAGRCTRARASADRTGVRVRRERRVVAASGRPSASARAGPSRRPPRRRHRATTKPDGLGQRGVVGEVDRAIDAGPRLRPARPSRRRRPSSASTPGSASAERAGRDLAGTATATTAASPPGCTGRSARWSSEANVIRSTASSRTASSSARPMPRALAAGADEQVGRGTGRRPARRRPSRRSRRPRHPLGDDDARSRARDEVVEVRPAAASGRSGQSIGSSFAAQDVGGRWPPDVVGPIAPGRHGSSTVRRP